MIQDAFIYDCTPHFVHFVYKFTGKERDSESGNDYFGARYYASSMGRWTSPDLSVQEEPVPYAKMDNPQSLNLYSYVWNNPLKSVDPDGHDNYTYDQAGNETSHTDQHGFWWHTIHDDNYTLNADDGKSYKLDSALTKLGDGQRYTLVSPEASEKMIGSMMNQAAQTAQTNIFTFGANSPHGGKLDFEWQGLSSSSLYLDGGGGAHQYDFVANEIWGYAAASRDIPRGIAGGGVGGWQMVDHFKNGHDFEWNWCARSASDQPADNKAIGMGFSRYASQHPLAYLNYVIP
jgi:RHS repeat-associated protein